MRRLRDGSASVPALRENACAWAEHDGPEVAVPVDMMTAPCSSSGIGRGFLREPRHTWVSHAVVVVLATASGSAGAEPAPPEPPAATPKVASAAITPRTTDPAARQEPRVDPGASNELTAADVAGAPTPGSESGRIDPKDSSDSGLRRALRGALFVPRLGVDLALSPARLSVWAFDRYHLDALYYRVFYNDARTIGLVPTAAFDSRFGLTAGARFVDHDLLGRHEDLSIEAASGGRYHGVIKTAVRSGDRLGDRLAIELDGQYELRPQDPFYGIGNHSDSASPAAPVDPAVDATAVETRYRERLARTAAVIDLRLVDGMHLRSSSELTDRRFSPSDTGVPINSIYDPMTLIGYDGVRYVYSELELRFDTRRNANEYEPRPLYSVGSLAALFGGRIHRLDNARDYWRYGVDLQHFIRLAEGPRVLALRFHGEAVSGTLAEVPFTELPQLGGLDDLRGYPTDRFRDRVAAFGSIDYAWDVAYWLSARAFVDAGRVFGSLDAVGIDHVRVGYGVALEGHSLRSFGALAALSSSIDGGLFLNLSFNPLFTLDERVRRR